MRTLIVLLSLLTLTPVALGDEPTPAVAPAPVREIEVAVHGGAFHPDRIEVKAGEPFRLRFVKHDWDGCTREVVLPWLGERRTLPTGEPVAIDVPPQAPGSYGFTCGMGMVKGTVVVLP